MRLSWLVALLLLLLFFPVSVQADRWVAGSSCGSDSF